MCSYIFPRISSSATGISRNPCGASPGASDHLAKTCCEYSTSSIEKSDLPQYRLLPIFLGEINEVLSTANGRLEMMFASHKIILLGTALFALACVMFSAQADDGYSNAKFQAEIMFRMGNPEILKPGVALLTRTKDGVKVKVFTSALVSGDAYTLWWVIFNNPENCAQAPGYCTAGDFGTPEVRSSQVYAAGAIAAEPGVANFSAALGERSTPKGVQVRFGPGLLDAEGAEIHVVVRTHGRVDPEFLTAQLTTFGGCNPGPDPAGCMNVQAARFDPVDDGDDYYNDDDDDE